MKATADAVQVQAQNSITLAQIWEPQMQHHELQKCRTEHAAGQRPLLPQSQRAGEQRRHDEDRRTDDGESVKVATTGSSCSTPLPAAGRAEMEAGRRSRDGGWTGGAGRTPRTEDGGCTSRRPLLPTGGRGQMAGTSRDGRRRRRPRRR